MIKPKVYNKRRDVVPDAAVYVGRGSPYGNPFKRGVDGTRTQVIDRFVREILPDLDVSELVGKDLVCYCKPKRCHGDYIMEKIRKLYPFG